MPFLNLKLMLLIEISVRHYKVGISKGPSYWRLTFYVYNFSFTATVRTSLYGIITSQHTQGNISAFFPSYNHLGGLQATTGRWKYMTL